MFPNVKKQHHLSCWKIIKNTKIQNILLSTSGLPRWATLRLGNVEEGDVTFFILLLLLLLLLLLVMLLVSPAGAHYNCLCQGLLLGTCEQLQMCVETFGRSSDDKSLQ